MAKKRVPQKQPALHGILALGSCILVAALLMSGIRHIQNITASPAALLVLITHHGKETLVVTAAKNSTPGIVELLREGSGSMTVSLPEQMKLREVRGVPLSTIQIPAAAHGMRAWAIPKDATLSFILEPMSPSSVIIRSLNDESLFLKMRTVDVASGSVVSESALLGKGDVVMW